MKHLLFVLCIALVAVGSATAKEWPGKVPSKADRGSELWKRHCVACHGSEAKGDGPLAAAWLTPVPDLSDGLGGRNRDALVRKILRGTDGHPAFEQSLRDLKPYKGDVQVYAENVLDALDAAARRQPEGQPDPDEDEDEDEDEVQPEPGGE